MQSYGDSIVFYMTWFTFSDNPLHVSDAAPDNVTYAQVVKPKRSSQPKPAAAKPDEATADHAKAGPSNQATESDTTYAQVVKPKGQQKAASTPKVYICLFVLCN